MLPKVILTPPDTIIIATKMKNHWSIILSSLKKEPRLTLTLAEDVLAMTLLTVSFSSGLMNHILRPESGANLPTWTQGWFPSINFARMPWAKGLEKPVYYSAFLNVCINHPMVYTYQTLLAVSFSITSIDCTLR